jgi:hypothetical protein
MTVISKEAKKELIDVIQKRYNQASKIEKGKILAEFVSVSGYHRKHAIRLLNPRLKGNLEVMIKRVVPGSLWGFSLGEIQEGRGGA